MGQQHVTWSICQMTNGPEEKMNQAKKRKRKKPNKKDDTSFTCRARKEYTWHRTNPPAPHRARPDRPTKPTRAFCPGQQTMGAATSLSISLPFASPWNTSRKQSMEPEEIRGGTSLQPPCTPYPPSCMIQRRGDPPNDMFNHCASDQNQLHLVMESRWAASI